MNWTTKNYSEGEPERRIAVDPWSYDPSSWRQRVPICLLACVAFVIAGHMALYQWRIIDTVWDPVFGEQSRNVLDSNVAQQMQRWFGVPDAALGALAYLGDAIFGLAGSKRRWQDRPWLVILFGIDVLPLGVVSAILVVCQATIVGYWCLLCLFTAVISLVLVYMAYDEVYSSLVFLYRVWQRTHSPSSLWSVFWGKPLPIAEQAAREMVRYAA